MDLRLLFILSFIILALAAIGSVGYFSTIVLGHLLSGSAYTYAAIQSGVIAVLLLLFIGTLFFILGRYIIGPIGKLTQAIRGFAERGERLPIMVSPNTPREIRELIRSFVELIGSVEAAHQRDAEMSRVKSDFITTAAHQLRTPLTGVRWSLEALEKSPLSEEQLALAKSANDKIHDLVAIVSTLLDISSIESGKYKYRFTPVDMAILLAEIANDFKLLANERKVLLSLEVSAGLPNVHADRDRIKWVLNNLVENAIRYTPEGGTVRIMAEPLPTAILVRVRDTGIGIREQDRTNIFERFYRAPNAVTKENEGNGLGLYIARTIAKDHEGDLDFAANDHGPGTTFALTLPMEGGVKGSMV